MAQKPEIKDEILKLTTKRRGKVLHDISTHKDYKEMRVLRDMLSEFLDLSHLIAEGEQPSIKREVAQNVTKALDVHRSINEVNLLVWASDIEALLVNKREMLYGEIVNYANERGFFVDYKIKL